MKHFASAALSAALAFGLPGHAWSQVPIATLPPAVKAAKGKVAKAPKATDAAAPADAAPATAAGVQPAVMAMAVDKCIDCKSSVKKRIAVLPTRVGSVASDAGSTPEALAAIVSDKLESALRTKPEMLVLARGSLPGVIAEQDLAGKGVVNAELAAPKGRIIPAEVLLHVSLDRVDVRQEVNRQVSSDAAANVARAEAAEREALSAREDAADQQRRARDSAAAAEQFRNQNAQNKAQMEQYAKQGTLKKSAANWGALSQAIGAYGEASSKSDSEAATREAEQNLMLADRKLVEARQLRARAQSLASTDLAETKRTTATIAVVWRAVDVATNELVAGDTVSLSDSYTDRRRVTAVGQASSESVEATRAQGLVNGLIDKSLAGVINQLSASLDKVPFRGSVVRVDRAGVVLNVGNKQGVEIGDTFAVRRVDNTLVDPTTGRSLAGPGTLEGLIRVVEVNDQVSKAVVLKSAGILKRADNLEWVGVYK